MSSPFEERSKDAGIRLLGAIEMIFGGYQLFMCRGGRQSRPEYIEGQKALTTFGTMLGFCCVFYGLTMSNRSPTSQIKTTPIFVVKAVLVMFDAAFMFLVWQSYGGSLRMIGCLAYMVFTFPFVMCVNSYKKRESGPKDEFSALGLGDKGLPKMFREDPKPDPALEALRRKGAELRAAGAHGAGVPGVAAPGVGLPGAGVPGAGLGAQPEQMMYYR